MAGGLKNPHDWQGYAEETRRIAATMRDIQARAFMLTIAKGYDEIARQEKLRLFVRRALLRLAADCDRAAAE